MSDTSLHRRSLEKTIRQLVVLKYVLLILGTIIAGVIGFSSNVEHYIGENYAHVARELLSGIVAALLISLIYDRGIKKQEELQRKLEQDELLKRLSRETLLGNLAALGNDEVDELSQRIIEDKRFKESIIRVTATQAGNFGSRKTAGILHALWDRTTPKRQSWQSRLLKNESDPTTYFFECVQKLTWHPGASVFRVLLTERAFVSVNIISSGERERFDGAIAVHKLNRDVAHSFTQRDNHRLKIIFEDLPRSPLALTGPKLLKYQPEGGDGPDLAGTEVFILEFPLPAKDWKGRVTIEWYWKSLSSFMQPFCYVQADELSFVGDLTMEYGQVADTLGQVWVQGFVGGEGLEIQPDPYLKQVKVSVNGPMMPGEGIVLMWRPKSDGEP